MVHITEATQRKAIKAILSQLNQSGLDVVPSARDGWTLGRHLEELIMDSLGNEAYSSQGTGELLSRMVDASGAALLSDYETIQ